ncbi:MAG: PAS domain S-box protein, partial [Alphaproteobacteria bacterium]|nr:PAS domain S-box protein [Alphaproteobacteria bacterium]
LVVIIFAAGLAVWDRREDAIARSRQETTTLGTVLAEQTARSIQAVDLVLQQTQAMLVAAGADTPERFREAAATQEVHSFLRDRWKALPQADAIALVGADGKLVNTSRNWPAQSIDLSDRDYVKWARQDNDAPIFISVPAVSRSSGDWSFFLARRIDGASGELIGLVLSAIDIRYLEDFFRAISLHNGGSVAAFRRDGTMLARFPPVENMAGGKLPEQSGFYTKVEEGGGSYFSPGYVDGIARIVSVHPLPNYPLVIAVSMAEDAVLANWRTQSLLIALGTLCTVIGFMLLFRALVAHSRSLERSEATLRQSEARCRDFALTSSDWFWETDQQQQFTYLSDHIRAFGQDPQTRIGRTRSELASDFIGEPDKWREHLSLLDRHEPFRDFVYRPKAGDGRERVISVSGNPFFDEAGGFLGYRGTARDVTEQVMAEQVLHDAKAAAEAANLAKSQFLANMSHELRTPLNAILGFSEVLENGIGGPLQPRQAEYVGLIRQSGEHLLHLINEILDLARIDAGKLELREEVLDTRRLVDGAVALVKDRAADSLIKLSVDIEENMPPVLVDRTRLTEILLNLLSNAIKFTELGGKIGISARRTQGGGAEFVVRDNGCGMTQAEIEIAVERFGQVDGGLARVHEGSGLGLPLARKLVELHGGSLTLRSEKGRGTTATVLLPSSRVLMAEPAAAGHLAPREAAPTAAIAMAMPVDLG